MCPPWPGPAGSRPDAYSIARLSGGEAVEGVAVPTPPALSRGSRPGYATRVRARGAARWTSETMIGRRPARFRVLAVVHVVVGLLSLPVILVFGLTFAPLLIAGPVWLMALGVRLWRRGEGARAALQRTHVVLLVVATLLSAYGRLALQAARGSAAKG